MSLTRLFSLVVVFDILGLLVANESFSDKLVNGTAINAPFPFVVVQGLVVLAATRYRAGAAVLALLCLISVFSGTTDGSYAADLAAAERVIQIGVVVTTLLLGATALRNAIRPARAGGRLGSAACRRSPRDGSTPLSRRRWRPCRSPRC